AVCLTPRTPLAPQPADLEHQLTAACQEASETGAERTGAFDRERAPTHGVLVDEFEGVRVSLVVRADVRLEHDRAADHVHDRERVRVAVRIDTNHVVQLICKQPLTDLQPKRWGTHPVSVWGGNRGRQNCDESRAHNADRLLIRPASGRQADTGLSARTHHWKDTATVGHSRIESQTESTDANLTNAPDGTPAHSQFGNDPRRPREPMTLGRNATRG